jgi:hypothetical protein
MDNLEKIIEAGLDENRRRPTCANRTEAHGYSRAQRLDYLGLTKTRGKSDDRPGGRKRSSTLTLRTCHYAKMTKKEFFDHFGTGADSLRMNVSSGVLTAGLLLRRAGRRLGCSSDYSFLPVFGLVRDQGSRVRDGVVILESSTEHLSLKNNPNRSMASVRSCPS